MKMPAPHVVRVGLTHCFQFWLLGKAEPDSLCDYFPYEPAKNKDVTQGNWCNGNNSYITLQHNTTQITSQTKQKKE